MVGNNDIMVKKLKEVHDVSPQQIYWHGRTIAGTALKSKIILM
ncbi:MULTISPECIES: hypothetical protein [Rodentibacter]|nr:hypothetical protein [Rodentibacter sp. JRC1]